MGQLLELGPPGLMLPRHILWPVLDLNLVLVVLVSIWWVGSWTLTTARGYGLV